VIVAERQTAGRGRMGREWIAAPGDSLTFSLLWRFAPGTALSGLSLAVGVAVARALEKVMRSGIPWAGVHDAPKEVPLGGAPKEVPLGDNAPIQLKWPNDVLRNGRKLAGILIELQSNTVAVIGIGLNRRLPDAMPAVLRETSAALDAEIDANSLLAALLVELLPVLDGFAGGGFAALRDEWLARHAWTGKPVRVLASPGAAVATPLETDPIRMTPAATSGGKPKVMAIAKPTSGMMMNWRATPMKTGQGIVRTFRKSLAPRVVPMPKVMTWMSGTIRTFRSVPNQERKAAGVLIEAATETRTQRVKAYFL
jgi:BirA family biotin operon repressor/biotin-[acetyl-CoA-carboxylase] ligase